MHVPSLAITLLSLSLVTARAPPHHRHLGKAPLGKRHELVRRAGGTISNDTIDAMPSDEANMLTHGAAAATSSAVVAQTSEAAGSGQAGDIVTPTTSPTAVASSVQPTTAPSSSAAAPSVVVESTTESAVEQVVASPSPSIVESSAIASPSTTPLSVVNAPVTLSSVSPTVVTAHVASSERATVVTKTRTDSSSASAASSNEDTSEKSGGLSKTALIAIIVVASVVGAGAILVFAIRKWKLRKSGRFDSRMKPIDFSPHNDGMGNDDFLEKTLQRTASNASADRQRQQFVKELEADPNYVAGVPEHDFTAGAAANHAGYGAYNDTYNDDPFARAQVYEYDQDAYYGHDAHGYPRAEPHVGYAQGAQDYPTQDQPAEGYADLQRGNSTGSDHARSAGGHGSAQFTDFPSPDNYLGRPTGGIDGPYAQAAQYRAY